MWIVDEMGMGKTLQAVSLIVTHPREGEILGPDSSPGAVAAAVEAPAPKMKLRLPCSLKRDEHAHGNTAPSAGNTAPSADAADAEAEAGSDQGKNCESGSEPASLQSPEAKRPDVDTKSASTPVNVGSKKKQPSKDADDKGKQEGSVSPEGKSGKKGKAAPKEKKKKVDPLIAAMQQAKECYAEPEDNGTDNFCGATLVICPVVAALQWQQEIVRYTGAGVCQAFTLHHGNPTRYSLCYQRSSDNATCISYTVGKILISYDCSDRHLSILCQKLTLANTIRAIA